LIILQLLLQANEKQTRVCFSLTIKMVTFLLLEKLGEKAKGKSRRFKGSRASQARGPVWPHLFSGYSFEFLLLI
jgi:hypothetical protein